MAKRSFDRLTPGHEPIINDYGVGTPEYQRACQDLIDQQQWRGTGQPAFPASIRVHEYDGPEDIMDIYRRKESK